MHIAPSIPRLITQPTTAELVVLALADGDFLGNLAPHDHLTLLAAEVAADAAARWEDDHDALPGSVLPARVDAASVVLRDLAYDVLLTAERDALDALADAIEAGGLTRDGDPIPYDNHRSA